MAVTNELIEALRTLMHDATFAYLRSLENDDTGLEPLGRSMRGVEQAVQASDAEVRLKMRTALARR